MVVRSNDQFQVKNLQYSGRTQNLKTGGQGKSLREQLVVFHNWRKTSLRRLASDLSSAMLERARRGCYSKLEVSRGLSPELLKGYFQEQENGWQISSEIRRQVEFRSINLSGPWPELPPLDLILLRNVLIYFDVQTRQQILGRVRRVLQPDGYLLLGGAETTINLDGAFVPVSFAQRQLLSAGNVTTSSLISHIAKYRNQKSF
jgi:chemotaxis methyl-accepting protein methylase